MGSDRLYTGGTFVYFVNDDGQMRLSLIIERAGRPQAFNGRNRSRTA